MTPKTSYGDARILQLIQEKPTHLNNIILEIIKIFDIFLLKLLQKTRADKSWRSVLKFLEISNMGPIAFEKHEMDFLKILNRGSIFFKKHTLGIW